MTAGPSYARGLTEPPLLRETIGANLARTAATRPTGEALVSVHQGVRLSYTELAAAVEGVALGLLALGVATGERVGIWSPNCVEWALLQYATARIGAILVNINPAYRTAELEYVLDQSGVSLLVLAPRFRDADFVDLARRAAAACPGLRRCVVLDDQAPEGWLPWAALIGRRTTETGDALARREATLRPDDPINIQYTSGTTGFPKGATLSHFNLLNNAYLTGLRCGYTHADRVCIPVPLYHCFGMVLGNLACTTHGATMVFPSEGFSAEKTLATVEAERCTSLYGVPTMFIAQLDHPRFQEFDLSSLRTGIMAGSPCPVELLRRVRSEMHMPEVTVGYGMTETSPISFQSLLHDEEERRVTTVGCIHPHVEAKVIDPATGETLPLGDSGELCTRGYLVMSGYWENQAATAGAIDADGWMHTGDLATLDEHGYCRIVGRIKDLVIRGGENIYPREVEEFLHGHPSVSDVQVIGVPDPRYGEELCAWVRVKPGASLAGPELREWCAGRIARYKIPRYWKFTNDFPMTVTGKVQKYRMREISAAELGLAPGEAGAEQGPAEAGGG